MNITPDSIVFFEYGFIKLNATIVYTWLVMLVLIVISLIATRKLSAGKNISKLQAIIETIIKFLRKQIGDIIQNKNPDKFIPFIGTLFLFITISALLSIIPYFEAPTGSLSTTIALAVCVFFAVPIFGIVEQGIKGYFKHYIEPTFVMLPFNIISEISRTLALAVRLFGNMMSGSMIVGILLSITPLFFPIIMQGFGLLIGVIQAYIFAILTTVYISSGLGTHDKEKEKKEKKNKKEKQKNK